MGTELTITSWPAIVGLLLVLLALVALIVTYLCDSPSAMFTGLAMVVVGGVLVGFSNPTYRTDIIEYPVEKTSQMELLGTRQAEGQQTNSKIEARDGIFTNYYKTEQTGGDVSRSIFVVKNSDGSYQQVRISSKQVKVYEDLQEGQAAYAVKHQGVYTNRHIYRPGETPLCLKDVDTNCQPNAILNTSNEDDNKYDLHVPAGTVRGGEYSFSNQ